MTSVSREGANIHVAETLPQPQGVGESGRQTSLTTVNLTLAGSKPDICLSNTLGVHTCGEHEINALSQWGGYYWAPEHWKYVKNVRI